MKIEYPLEWNEYEAFERKCKGWLSGVIVTLDNGSVHEVSFYDPVRLSQDLAEEVASGNAGIIEKGLLIIPEVTQENIEHAILQAVNSGFFSE